MPAQCDSLALVTSLPGCVMRRGPSPVPPLPYGLGMSRGQDGIPTGEAEAARGRHEQGLPDSLHQPH